MEINNIKLAEEYYKLIGQKNAEGFKKLLHPDVEFSSPVATLNGKEAVIESTSNFMNVIKSFKIRAKFGEQDQAMIVYNVDIPGVVKEFPSASLLTFRDQLIVKIELFFDGSPFIEKK